MENVSRSVMGAKLQTCQLLQLPFAIPQHATLNEKLNIISNIAIPDSYIPGINVAVIGNGGHKMISGTNGISYPSPIKHLPRHTGLYNMMPFVLREPSNDLSVSEISGYRLRTTLSINGVSYIAYYGKVLDLSSTAPQLYYHSVQSGSIETVTSFSPNSDDLNPTPPDLTSTGVISTSGDYINTSAQVPFTLSQADIDEYKNVANIIYGSEDMAIISEIGLCASMDKTINASVSGNNVTITEAAGTVITNFISAFYATRFCSTGINVALDVGALEKMLASS